MELLDYYTTTSQTVPAGATTGMSVPTTADTIAESRLYFSLERLRLLEQSMIMMRLQPATITPASATEGSPAVLNFANPSSADTTHTFTFTNGTAGSADYTTTSQTVTVPAGATTGTVCKYNCDTIAEPDLYYCLWNASATGTINDNDAAPTVVTITRFGYRRKSCCVEFSLSNPSAVDTTYTFTFTNGTAGVLITLPLRKQ
jgi:hypothetical protein